DVAGVADLFRQLQVYGLDFRVTPFGSLGISGAVTESKWTAQGGNNFQFTTFGIGENDRRAWDLRLDYPILRGLLTAYYKRIGDGFDAPGSWGRLGNWINPRGIEGFGGTLEIPVGRRLVLDLEGAGYNYRAFRRFGAPGSELSYVRGGLRYPLTSRNSVGLGYERVNYEADAPGGVDRLEQYYNIGIGHQFSPNMSVNLLYQFLNVHSNGALELPGFDYKANIIVTQFQARF
ncbi:MAG TPA: hypothetical protein VK689_14950, partial [Armatimonadota bacterium]|nr:hypothetical protein [Armatimonadota bacterium]